MRSTNILSIRGRTIAAFSLIEIVLAIAVISFALVGILGMFPVALKTATASQRETQAAFIARSIFSDLEAQSDENRFLLRGKDDTAPAEAASGMESKRYTNNRKNIDLTDPKSYYLAFDDDGLPLDDEISDSEYNSGMPKAGYLAKVTVVEPPTPPAPGISQLEVTVSAPGVAPEKKRTFYPFVSLLNNGKTQ